MNTVLFVNAAFGFSENFFLVVTVAPGYTIWIYANDVCNKTETFIYLPLAE